MNTFRILPTLSLLGVALCAAASLQAQTVFPGFSGYNRLALPGNSDSIVALPFARREAASGLVAGFSGSQVTLQGLPGWTAGQFVYSSGVQDDTYYLLVTSGAREGSSYTVTANSANAVTVDLDGDTLTGLQAGDHLSILPHWTLGTLFPAGRGVNIAAAPGNRPTEVMFPNYNSPTINASASRIFYFYNGNWREVGQGMAVRDNELLYPDACFTVRQNTATGTELVCSGQVITSKLLLPLGINTAGKRDNYLSLQRPVSVTLANSGLTTSGAFLPSPAPGTRTDELLIFDNASAKQNKTASAIFYYWNNAWRKVGSGAANFDGTVAFTPGVGFILRKNTATSSPVWSNAPGY